MDRDYAPTLVANGVDLALSGHLDGFTLWTEGQTAFFKVDSVLHGSYAVVSIGGGEPIEIEACGTSGCHPFGGP
jgi:hypothetical protein